MGKLLPLIKKDGLNAFKLKIFSLNNVRFKDTDALFLEQYLLLDNKYDLNTLRVVNFGPQLGKSVFIYNLSLTILYYSTHSQIKLKRNLGIHHSTSVKYVNSRMPYLDSFIFLSFPILTAIPSHLSEKEFLDLLNKKRQASYDSGSRRSKSVILEVKQGNKLVNPQKNTLEFESLISCALYLRSLGLNINRFTISNYIKQGKVFHGFLASYFEKTLLDNSVYVKLGKLIQEHMEKFRGSD